jgi:RimJ/RimL family protein N-acetyltransferase
MGRYLDICSLHSTAWIALVIEYRPFLNSDVAAIAKIWRQQRPFRCLSRSFSNNDFDRVVLSKPYFDPQGLILAFDNGTPIGFVHACFAPNAELSDVDLSTGIICQLRVVESNDWMRTSLELIDRAVNYLKRVGSRTCFAAAKFPHVPFYLGYYGGSRIPGIPEEDVLMRDSFAKTGFQPRERIRVYRCHIADFRCTVDRRFQQLRRKYQAILADDPLVGSWWECCSRGWVELIGYRLVDRENQEVVGRLTLWEIQPLSAQWGNVTMGLGDLWIRPNVRRTGLSTHLIGESLRQLAGKGVSDVEVQLRESDTASIAVFEKLGFHRFSTGTELKCQIQ